MKIIKCPACEQCVHFDFAPGIMKCWSCGAISDFSRIASAPENLLKRLNRAAGKMSFPDLSSASFHRASKAGVLLALPIAILMLLICNSFDISVVRDSKAPFASIRIPVENVVYDDQAIFTF